MTQRCEKPSNLPPYISHDSEILPMSQDIFIQDIFTQFLTHSRAQEIGACASVCREWKQMLMSNEVWRILFCCHFPSVNVEPIMHFKEAYHYLTNVTNAVYASHTLQGHESRVNSLVIADGKLFSGSDDDTIKVWEIKTGKCLATLKGHEAEVLSLVIADEKLFSGSFDNTIKVWEIKTGKCLATLKGHDGSVRSLVLDDGKLFSGSFDNTIKVWEIKTGECLATLNGHENTVFSLAIDGDRLFSCSGDKTIRVWDLKTYNSLAILKGHEACVNSLAIDDGRLFSCSEDKTIRGWDLKTYNHLATLESHEDYVVSLSTAHGMLFSGSGDSTINVWDIKTYKKLATLYLPTPEGGEDGDSVSSLAVTSDGTLYSGSEEVGTIRVWNFTADHNTIFQEIATLLESGDGQAAEHAVDRFQQMPKTAKNAIYGKLYEILKPFANDYEGCAEDAFFNEEGQSSTYAQIAQAIRDY